MSFAAQVTDMTLACFAILGEQATYTPPGEGAVTVPARAMIDEPNVDVMPGHPRYAQRDRKTELWLIRQDGPAGQWQGIAQPAKGAIVAVMVPGQVTRTFKIDSAFHFDPDRVKVSALETTA